MFVKENPDRKKNIDSILNFLLKAIPFMLVISSEGFKQKQLICNLFVTNLSDIHDFEGKILKKQVKSICLLSIMKSMLLKTEGNSSERKNL